MYSLTIHDAFKDVRTVAVLAAEVLEKRNTGAVAP